MKILDLIRVGSSQHGTFGVLRYGLTPFAVTLERPWVNNLSEKSSIPAGRYLCTRFDSPRFGSTFQVQEVPGRSLILFHKGNRVTDTEGCILLGEEFATDGATPVIASSAKGYAEFHNLLKDDAMFELRIFEPVLS